MASEATLCNVTSPEIIYQLQALAGQGNQAQSRLFNRPFGTLAALGNCSKMGITPDLVNERCQGIKIWYTDDSSFDPDAVYCGEEFDPNLGCEVGDGCQIATKCFEHSPNLFANKTIEVCDSKCDTELDFARESRDALAAGMNAIRQALNKKAITLLSSCASAAEDLVKCPPESFSFNGTSIEVPKDKIKDKDDFMSELAAFAALSGIPEYKIHTGSIWYSDQFSVAYKKLADCCGGDGIAEATALEEMLGSMITFDAENMYACLGKKAMFLWNPYQVGYYNFALYPETPTLVDEANGVYHWRVRDPFAVWTRNVYNEQGNLVSTQTVPVEYDIEYQKVCKGDRTSVGVKQFRHKWTIIHRGGMFTGPADNDGNTGILQFCQV